jgi:pyruvate/2-oxoglutarate/acetoin dehydrogenase E1 component
MVTPRSKRRIGWQRRVEVEVIDLTVADAVRQGRDFRVGRENQPLLIVHEDVKTLGMGSELSAVVVEERFDALDAPVMRVTYPDTHCPFSQVLESYNLPNADKIADGLRTADGVLMPYRSSAALIPVCEVPP